MTVCCYVFRKSKPIKFKAGNETLKAYRLEFSHNSGREDWGDHWSATDWQKKESRKLKRLRANSYPLKRYQFFVTFYSKEATELDLWSAGPGATKAWDDDKVIPGTWCGRLVKKESGRGWDYHSRGMVELRVKDLIRQAFLFIGRNPDMHVEESCSTYYDRLCQALVKDRDWDHKQEFPHQPWQRRAQMRTQKNKIYDLGFNLFQQEKLEQQQERKAL